MTDWENLETLAGIAELPWFNHSYKQLQEWENKREKNGFPAHKHKQGRYKFFDPEEVRKWYVLHLKATKHMGRGAELNAER